MNQYESGAVKFGQQYASEIHRRRPQPGDKWHQGRDGYYHRRSEVLSPRAVDSQGNVLDISNAEPPRHESS